MTSLPSFRSLARRLAAPLGRESPVPGSSPTPSPTSESSQPSPIHIPGKYASLVQGSQKKRRPSPVLFTGLTPRKQESPLDVAVPRIQTYSQQETGPRAEGRSSIRSTNLQEALKEILSEEERLYKTSSWRITRLETSSPKALKIFWVPAEGLTKDLENTLGSVLPALSGVLYKQLCLRAGLTSLPTRLAFVRDKTAEASVKLDRALSSAQAELDSMK
jgi:hypothetical protein